MKWGFGAGAFDSFSEELSPSCVGAAQAVLHFVGSASWVYGRNAYFLCPFACVAILQECSVPWLQWQEFSVRVPGATCWRWRLAFSLQGRCGFGMANLWH